MANITKKRVDSQVQLGGTPYGNGWKQKFELITSATGAAVDTDTAAAVGIGDVVRIGVLPAGLEIHDALGVVSDAFTATSTAKVGFAYVDGVDDTAVPQDDDYFFAALAIATAGRTRANNAGVRPVKLPKDAYLIVTNGVAAQAGVGVLDLIIEGVNKGTP